MRHTITSPKGGWRERERVRWEQARIGGEISNEFLFFHCVKGKERQRKKVNKKKTSDGGRDREKKIKIEGDRRGKGRDGV